MKLYLAFLILFFSMPIFSQEKIEWGEVVKSRGQINLLLPKDGKDFYTVRYQGGTFLGSNYFAYHSDFKLLHIGKIKSTVNKSTAKLEDVALIGGKPYALLSDRKGDKTFLYAQQYDSLGKPFDDPIKLYEYLNESKTWNLKGFYRFQFSENGEYFCVEFDVPATRSESERFGYRIFTKNFELTSKGEYELPYTRDEASIASRYLSNTGDYFLSVKVYQQEQKKWWKRDYSTLDKVIVKHVKDGSSDDYEIDLEDKKYVEVSFSSDNNRIMTFTGLYGEKGKDNGIKGIFYFILDFDKKEVLNQGFNEFDKDFITQDWTQREKDKANKDEQKGKGSPELFNYEIKELVTREDGSMIGLLEQYYVNAVTYTDPRGYSRTTYYYNYNDIIVYKINPEGEFEWVKKIPKQQVTTNDYGYYSSISWFVGKDELSIYFNDNAKNYNETGAFEEDKYEMSLSKKYNLLAEVKVDLNSGDMERKSFLNFEESKGLPIPKLFQSNYINNDLLMIFKYSRKERFGLVKF